MGYAKLTGGLTLVHSTNGILLLHKVQRENGEKIIAIFSPLQYSYFPQGNEKHVIYSGSKFSDIHKWCFRSKSCTNIFFPQNRGFQLGSTIACKQNYIKRKCRVKTTELVL